MNYENRGQIENRERARKIIDFTGLQYGKITPTDIDGMIDFGNNIFVFIELKYSKAEMPFGQKLAIERLVDCCMSAGKKSIAILAKHDIENPNNDIKCSDCDVVKYYYKGQWIAPALPYNVKNMIDKFSERMDTKK
jgi:hypothetical protein